MPSPDRSGRVTGLNFSPALLGDPLLGANFTGVDTHGHVFTRDLRMAEGRRYTPADDAPIGAYLAMLDANGISHGVLVQPSFLGMDNSYLLKSLRQAPERLRGIAVIAPDISAEELAALDGAGVVGVRLNLIGLPNPTLTDAGGQAFLRRIADLDWLVEVQAEAIRLPHILPLLLDAGMRVLVDHFGRPNQTLGVNCPGFRYLLSLSLTRRVWVKLSGAYRNGTTKPDGRVAALAAFHLLHTFGPDRLVWGSDWPHTGYEQLGTPDAARRALDHWVPAQDDRQTILVDTPRILFRFGAAVCEGPQQTNIHIANLPGERDA